jgi:Sulfatase
VLAAEHRVEAACHSPHPSTCQVDRRDHADRNRDGRIVGALIHGRLERVAEGVDELRLDGAALERVDGVVDHGLRTNEAEQPVRERAGGKDREDGVVGECGRVVAAAANQEPDPRAESRVQGAASDGWPGPRGPLDVGRSHAPWSSIGGSCQRARSGAIAGGCVRCRRRRRYSIANRYLPEDHMAKPFKGEINLDIRDSAPDWDAFLPDKAPEDAPNVLVVLYDDTGCAAWSPYGGRIEMPTLQRLANDGLTYSQWHTTALCSPTRSTFLTGRNHHQNGFASISETAVGFPGYNSHIPRENASMATVLRDAEGPGRCADLRHPRRRHRVHQGGRRREPGANRARQAVHRRRGRRGAGDPNGSVALQPVRRGTLHRI